jgi:hypothetical protein
MNQMYGINVFSRLSAKGAIAFGKNLADDLGRLYPVSLDGGAKAKISADRIGRILEKLYLQAQLHRDENKLGYYRKTRLCHAFNWRLIELGYSTNFIEMATEGLVVYLHKKPVYNDEKMIAQEKRIRKERNRSSETSKQASNQYTRNHPSHRYSELVRLYREMHEKGETFLQLKPEETFPGLSLPIQAPRILALIKQTGARHILDYGSGKGQQYQARDLAIPGEAETWPSIQDYWGVESVTCYDPSYTPFSELPRGAFDGVISTDVLEHCPEEDVPWIIDEIFSFARKFVFMNVACYPAKKRLPTGENAHCTIKPRTWWADIIRKTSEKHAGVRYEVRIQWKEANSLTEEVIRG